MLSLTDNTRRDKSLAGFSICADALNMFASQTRNLSHIEPAQSGNISSLSEAKAYRVNRVDISTEGKTRARIEGLFPFTLALLCLLVGLGYCPTAFAYTDAMPVLNKN